MGTTPSLSPIPHTARSVLQRIVSIALGVLYVFLVNFTLRALSDAFIDFSTLNWSYESREIIARTISILVLVVDFSIFLVFILFGNRWFRVLVGQGLLPTLMKHTFTSTLVLFGIFGVLIKVNVPGLAPTDKIVGRGFPWEWYSVALEYNNSTTMAGVEYAHLFINFVYWFFVSLLSCAIVMIIKYKRT